MQFPAWWMDLKGIMLSETSWERQTQNEFSHSEIERNTIREQQVAKGNRTGEMIHRNEPGVQGRVGTWGAA